MPLEVTVRVATPDDGPAVTALLEASYPTLMGPAYEKEVLEAALPSMTQANASLLSSGTYYLAERQDGGIVGAGGWTRERPGSGDVTPDLAHIRHFATHPGWTGRGIGRAIYAQCEAAARQHDLRRFECFASLNAVPFYAALGFAALRQVEVPMALGLSFPAVLMARPI
ncbi:MAG: GNAT family N-acetyltransferase [Kiloniellales bacterium]|nr:GNAT family N-acetyltransferase [Kiloniellales bacterium]